MPHIAETVSGGTRLEFNHAETANAIRAALRSAFTGVVFSVRMKRASMYQATNVSWEDGPTVPEVERVLSPFTSMTFNGSDDSTRYHEQLVDGQRVKYTGWVNTSRQTSSALRELATRRAALMGEENVHTVLYHMRPNGVVVRLKQATS